MENLGIDIKLLIAQLINFGIFFFIIKKFVAKPFTKFLNEERNKDEEKIRIMDKLKKGEETAAVNEKKMREKVKKELDILFAKSKKEAQEIKGELVKQAEGDAAEIRDKSKKLLEEERNILYREVKDKIVETSLMIVEKALKESLDETSRKQVTNYIIKNYRGKQTSI